MSLIALPAFLCRREATSMPEINIETKTDVVMRFRARGEAVVELSESSGTYSARCLGCDYDCGSYIYIANARDEANKHAGSCWSMPKPQGA
jgi:hypothetical protein